MISFRSFLVNDIRKSVMTEILTDDSGLTFFRFEGTLDGAVVIEGSVQLKDGKVITEGHLAIGLEITPFFALDFAKELEARI
jgi:hypothetical protein